MRVVATIAEVPNSVTVVKKIVPLHEQVNALPRGTVFTVGTYEFIRMNGNEVLSLTTHQAVPVANFSAWIGDYRVTIYPDATLVLGRKG